MACGGAAVKGSRRVISLSNCERVALLWKEIVSEELDRKGKQIDLDTILDGSIIYMCKKCFYAYENFLDSKKVSRYCCCCNG